MSLGSITPKNLVEGLDLVLGDDDRSAANSPATGISQEPRLLDNVCLLPDPLPSLVSVNLSEGPGTLSRGQTVRPVAHETERLEIELGRRHLGEAAK